MRKYGLAARSRVRKSALLDYSLRNLEAGIRDKGLRGFARELGVDPGTIHHHLKTRKTKKRR
jgi:hypothetical protein